MNSNLKISIITVSFNSVVTIRDTIESILIQDYKRTNGNCHVFVIKKDE